MKTFHTFASVETFQKYLRTKHEHCEVAGKYGGCLDYVRVAGILYTMHEYDSAGKTITWANKKHNVQLELETANRYRDGGYDDAVVWLIEDPWYMRSDISYAE